MMYLGKTFPLFLRGRELRRGGRCSLGWSGGFKAVYIIEVKGLDPREISRESGEGFYILYYLINRSCRTSR